MAVTYDWSISSLECHAKLNKKENVVFNVHWRLSATEDQLRADTYGVETLNTDNLKNFTAYSDLTKEIVVGWVESALGEEKITEMKLSLSRSIEDQRNPPVVSPPLPWNPVPVRPELPLSPEPTPVAPVTPSPDINIPEA